MQDIAVWTARLLNEWSMRWLRSAFVGAPAFYALV